MPNHFTSVARGAAAALILSAAGLAGGLFTGMGSAEAAFACSVADVSLDLNGSAAGGGLNATACSELNIGSNGTNTYINALNTAFAPYAPFLYLDRTGDPSATLSGGIQVTVGTSSLNTSDGTWVLQWTDSQPNTAPNLPATIDLAVVFKAAETEVGYLFNDLLLSTNPSAYGGEFEIRWTNGGGQIPGLSHIFAGGSNLTAVTPPTSVPEPASLALFGMGLLGLGAVRRTRRQG